MLRVEIHDSANSRIVDLVGEFIPTVPSHGGCPCETVVANRVQWRRSDASGQGALARRNPMRDHRLGWLFGFHLRELQFVSNQLALVCNAPLA